MSVALFVESQAEPLEGLPSTAQTVLFGHNGEVHIYHRISNGTKGKGQAWKRIASDELYLIPTEPILNNPVGVITTARDMELVSVGQITNITVKALYANENAEVCTTTVSHQAKVIELGSRLIDGDSTLSQYVIDKRTASGYAEVTLSPLTAPIADSTEVVTPKYEAVEVVALDNKVEALSLSMVTVPDIKYAERYVNRRFDGVTEWEIYDHALENGVNVLLEGGAGSGKTMSVQGYASKRGMRYFNVSSNQGIDPSQLFGRWIPDPKGGYRWQDGAVTLLVRHGGVLLINEINFLPARISTVLFSLLDYRREIQLMENGGEVIKAHPDLLIIADMNIGTEYKGTQELNAALADRFGIKLEFPYDRAIENKVVKSKALLVLADQLRDQYEKEEISTPISTRSLVAFMENAQKFGVSFATTSFVNGFRKEERGGIRLACDTHKDNIAIELGQSVTSYESHEDKTEDSWGKYEVRA